MKCSPERLQETLDLMVEKELRIRTPIEEVELLSANHKAVLQNVNVDDE